MAMLWLWRVLRYEYRIAEMRLRYRRCSEYLLADLVKTQATDHGRSDDKTNQQVL